MTLTIAEAGIVSTQATTIRIAIFHFIHEIFVNDPPPIIYPAIVCVVEIAIPILVARKIVKAPAVSAQKPCTGFNLVNFIPIVLTILHPPNAVPIAMAKWQERIIQSVSHRKSDNCLSELKIPPAISNATITPIVFCASLPPCPSE